MGSVLVNGIRIEACACRLAYQNYLHKYSDEWRNSVFIRDFFAQSQYEIKFLLKKTAEFTNVFVTHKRVCEFKHGLAM